MNASRNQVAFPIAPSLPCLCGLYFNTPSHPRDMRCPLKPHWNCVSCEDTGVLLSCGKPCTHCGAARRAALIGTGIHPRADVFGDHDDREPGDIEWSLGDDNEREPDYLRSPL